MSITKGAMLISNANAVGTELVNKLGGTGYTPNEWSDAINLLGISNDDKASALASITEGTYPGEERGAIKYSNCNAVGSMLNKKFSTDRGFKPVEWESAISKLTPLAERTVSGAIATFPDGADGVPLKKCEITLPASLDGYSEVDVVSAGVNLWDEEWEEGLISASDGQNTPSDQYSRTKNYITVKPSISVYLFLGVTRLYIRRYGKDKGYLGYAQINTSSVWNVPSDTYYIRFCWDGTTYTDNISVNYPSTETAYNSANNPTTHTASLGRTIYGGTADMVIGQGTDEKVTYTLNDSDSWAVYSGASHSFWHNVATGDVRPIDQTTASESICNHATFSSVSPASAPDFTFTIQGGQRIVFTADSSIDTVDKLKTWLESNQLTFVCPSSTPETFTFDPVPIYSKLGNNTLWSEQGSSTEVTYRKDPDIPDTPVQVIDMNNNNENNDN